MSETVQLNPGDSAPAFTALDEQGNEHPLQAYLDDGKTVILYFYPKDSTPGCTTQACDFRDNMARLTGEGHVVLGVSKDSQKSHARFVEKQELNFPLLVDEDLILLVEHVEALLELGRERLAAAFPERAAWALRRCAANLRKFGKF